MQRQPKALGPRNWTGSIGFGLHERPIAAKWVKSGRATTNSRMADWVCLIRTRRDRSGSGRYHARRKSPPSVRASASCLIVVLKEPPENFGFACVGCTGEWEPGSRVGQRLLLMEAMQFTRLAVMVHWGFGLGKNKLSIARQ